MKVNFEHQNQTTFNAKVSPRFISSMRKYVNNGADRLKNNYLLSQKLEQYGKFGYDDYTIEMHQRNGRFGYDEYKLVAVKNGENSETGVILAIRNSYRKIFERFMSYNKHDFCSKMNSRIR